MLAGRTGPHPSRGGARRSGDPEESSSDSEDRVEEEELIWGPQAGVDGTDGEHPRYTTVTGCTAREVGLYEKQSSFFVQATQPV